MSQAQHINVEGNSFNPGIKPLFNFCWSSNALCSTLASLTKSRNFFGLSSCRRELPNLICLLAIVYTFRLKFLRQYIVKGNAGWSWISSTLKLLGWMNHHLRRRNSKNPCSESDTHSTASYIRNLKAQIWNIACEAQSPRPTNNSHFCSYACHTISISVLLALYTTRKNNRVILLQKVERRWLLKWSRPYPPIKSCRTLFRSTIPNKRSNNLCGSFTISRLVQHPTQ